MARPQPALSSVISSRISSAQLREIRRATVFTGVFLVAGAVVMGAVIFRFVPIKAAAPAAAVVSLLGGIVAWAMRIQFRSDARTIVEYSCTGDSFRFRTLGSSKPVEIALSEVSSIGYFVGRNGPTGYDLVFRDGTEARVPYDSRHADALIERLRPYCDTIQDYAECTERP